MKRAFFKILYWLLSPILLFAVGALIVLTWIDEQVAEDWWRAKPAAPPPQKESK